MSNTTKAIIFAFAVFGALVFAFFLLFEKVEKERNISESAKAGRNPFLAAERFLTESGIETESVARKKILINLPSTRDLIFVNRLGGNLPGAREDNLIEWIKKGGSLVITHDRFWDEKTEKSGDTFFDRLDIRLSNTENNEKDTESSKDAETEKEELHQSDPGKEAEITEEKIKSIVGLSKKEKVIVSFDNELAEIEMNARRTLECYLYYSEEDPTTFEGKNGTHIIIQKIGGGKLIVLSDNRFLTNREIGNNDHAWFLLNLASERDKVWILYNSLMPSFFSVLFQNALFFIGTMIVFIIAFILRLNMTIGPVRQIQDFSSRNIIENLLASGTFIMRQGKSAFLIHRSRKTIEKNLARKSLWFEGKNEKRMYDLIANQTGLSEEQIRQAFLAEAGNSEDFIRITGLLQQIYYDLLVNNKKTEMS